MDFLKPFTLFSELSLAGNVLVSLARVMAGYFLAAVVGAMPDLPLPAWSKPNDAQMP